MRACRLFLGLVFLALPLPVSADPVTGLVAVRSVFADAAVIPVVPIRVPVYNRDVLTTGMTVTTVNGTATSSASLTSSIDGSGGAFSGEGKTSVAHSSTGVASGGYTQIDYGTTFMLSTAQQFALAATFFVAGQAVESDSKWSIALWTADRSAVFNFAGGESQDVFATGLLPAGEYLFGMFSVSRSFFAGTGGSSNTFDFNLAFTDPVAAPTPEPASLVLLGTGLLGVLARHRMQRRHG